MDSLQIEGGFAKKDRGGVFEGGSYLNVNYGLMRQGAWQNYLSFGLIFAFLPLYGPRKSKFWKMKKFEGDIIILHMCTKNNNHMMYSSRDREWDRQNFLSFWAIFCPFSPLTTQKIKILKLKKTPGDIIILLTHLHHK